MSVNIVTVLFILLIMFGGYLIGATESNREIEKLKRENQKIRQYAAFVPKDI